MGKMGLSASEIVGRGMDLNPELLSAIDRLCVGLVVQCMFQCRVHNLNMCSGRAMRASPRDNCRLFGLKGPFGCRCSPCKC